MKRLIVLCIVVLGLSPGLWWRSPPPLTHYDDGLTVVRMDAPERVGDFQVLGLWQLASLNAHFGGYSALVLPGDGTLLAASDRGSILRMPPPDREGAAAMRELAEGGTMAKRDGDIESLTRDPATGRLWFGFESSNSIERRDAQLGNPQRVRPTAMKGWPGNSGPEAMVRLADGRFLVISEGSSMESGPSPALLFPGDPVEGARPLQFAFEAPDGMRPVDAVQLPDGDVLVLARKVEWALPPGFLTAIVRADPKGIEAGKPWRGEVVARFAGDLPRDNFEGLALDPDSPPDAPVLWLLSDDNGGEFQRTLLYKLRLAPTQKARGSPRTP